MADVLVLGGGICGAATAILLARDGHRVTVLERDPQPIPETVDDAWDRWERRAVAQFRQPHYVHARFRHLLEAELPDVPDRLVELGAVVFDPIANLPPSLGDRSRRPDDDRFTTITGRRPMMELVFARALREEPGVEVRQPVTVAGVLTGAEAIPGVPHVVGVRTEDGEELRADVVVDALGRRSPMPDWVAASGGRRPVEEASECGFTYYSRYFRGDELPAVMGPLGCPYGTISLLTLPSDNRTWSVTVFTSTGDTAVKALRHTDVFMDVVRSFPLQAHWADGEPTTEVLPMSGIMDRYRRYAVDGRPVVTGMLAVADAWACTNPSLGRGLSLGLLHAVRLRDALRDDAGSPPDLAERWDDITETELAPWYRMQLDMDRARVAEIDALREVREPPPPGDPGAELRAAVNLAAPHDPDVFRGMMETVACLSLPDEVFSRPGLIDKTMAAAEGRSPQPLPGPDRARLLELVS